ncbi:Choline monooxygenase, chloroplastic [Vitis vinifera]|uniref:Choline monooxygenase, chloroplastic n=1 Tax=Vitis vinifera TaxID=29760 RepID=A0A438CY87_VITVI|nr:Choline monooxygenase, chloroplastic [Vitis vinifera]
MKGVDTQSARKRVQNLSDKGSSIMAIIFNVPLSSSSSSRSKFNSRNSHILFQKRCPFPNRTIVNSSSAAGKAPTLLHKFNPRIPVEQALTPPSSWYTDPSFLALELDRVFYRGWQAVGKQSSMCVFFFLCACGAFGFREGRWTLFGKMQVWRPVFSAGDVIPPPSFLSKQMGVGRNFKVLRIVMLNPSGFFISRFSGYTEQIKNPRDFFTGSRLGNVEFVVCRDNNGKLHAFHNVCRHHASLLAYGSGQKSCFVCPYHVSLFTLLCTDYGKDLGLFYSCISCSLH